MRHGPPAQPGDAGGPTRALDIDLESLGCKPRASPLVRQVESETAGRGRTAPLMARRHGIEVVDRSEADAVETVGPTPAVDLERCRIVRQLLLEPSQPPGS